MSKSRIPLSEAAGDLARVIRRRKARKRRRDRQLTPNRALKGSSGSVVRTAIELRPYQVEAKHAALAILTRPEGGGFCLFMEQRTGKTPTACALIQELNPTTLLIACPSIAVDVWEKHLLQYGLYEGREVKIVTFESSRSLRKWLKRWEPEMVIIDESHRIKSAKRRGSQQGRALRAIGRTSRWRLALTGTPLEGKIWDAWAQFDFIDPSIFGTWGEFKERYLVYGGFKGKQIVGTQNEEEFQAKFQSRFYRVLLEDVKEVKTDIAPPQLVRFDLVESRAAYDAMDKKFVVDLGPRYVKVLENGRFVQRKKRIVAPRVITQVMKLHQLSGGFILDDGGTVHRFGDEKLAHTGALLKRLGNVPTVVFVRFIPELYRIATLVRAMGRTVSLLSGSHKFKEFTTDVIVVQIRSGISIDLSRAEEVIFHSWGHSFLDYDQAKFRIRSFTSARARYHYLIANGTVDEQLFEAVTRKMSVVSLFLDKARSRA